MDYAIKLITDFAIVFIIVFVIYSFYMKKKKKDINDLKKDDYIYFFISRYKLNLKKTEYKTIIKTLTFVNSFSLSFAAAMIINIDGFILRIVVAFIVLFLLLMSLYEVSGRVLKKKEGKKK